MFTGTPDGQPINCIIPHIGGIRQANLPPNHQQTQTKLGFASISTPPNGNKTPLQAQALRLYDLGFNVFPQPLGKKAGFPWKRLQYTRLHRDHQQFGLKAVFTGQSNLAIMCGKTSDNLFIIDCESKACFNYHIAQIRQRNIPLWAAETARGGHIYLRCSEGELANIDQGLIPNLEIKGCRRYVLAPPSIHPTGTVYTWLAQDSPYPPIVNTETIDWLVDKHNKPIKLKLDQPKKQSTNTQISLTHNHHRLSRSTLDYLANGHEIPEGSRNNRLFSAACDMAGNNYGQHKTHAMLSPIATESGLPITEIQQTINSAFSRTRLPAKPEKTQKYEFWQQALIYAQNKHWEGRTATSDKTVFLALVKRAKADADKNGTFRASIREISIIARIGTATTQKSLKRLQNTSPPLIHKISRDKTSEATLWQFSKNVITSKIQLKTDTLPPSPPWLVFGVSVFSSGDFWERGALGSNGVAVYLEMISYNRAVMPSVLAERVRLKVYQVQYALRKLCDFGLVRRSSDGWEVLSLEVEELDARVSRVAGTLGKGEARRQRYADERAIYAGRILLEGRLRIEGCSGVKSDSVKGSGEVVSSCGDVVHWVNSVSGAVDVKIWTCPNCGQTHFGDLPPDMCDVCNDFTTWRLVEAEDGLDDPLVILGLELGGVVGDEEKSAMNLWLRERCSKQRFSD